MPKYNVTVSRLVSQTVEVAIYAADTEDAQLRAIGYVEGHSMLDWDQGDYVGSPQVLEDDVIEVQP